MRTFDFEKAKALSTIIVDEASMVELRLFNCIAGATGADTRLIMVGDSAQLPPVGPGRVFHDLVETARLPVVELRTIHRQASANPIPHAAAAIRRGETPELPLWQGQTTGVYILPVENEREGQKCVVSLTVDSLHQLGYALEDVQVLTPRRGGLVGTQELNRLMRARLGRPVPGILFTVGDRVIQTVNNYDLGSHGIMNGQTGTVISVAEDGIVVDFEGEEVEVSVLNLSDLDHAYAVTVHKSQGSQYPVVILPLYASAGRLLNRALVYTAITRATDLVVLVGTSESLARAVADQSGTLRTTAFPYHLSSALAQSSTTQAPTMIQQRLWF
jgi:exodeoxyribonuclease V alpha subunit